MKSSESLTPQTRCQRSQFYRKSTNDDKQTSAEIHTMSQLKHDEVCQVESADLLWVFTSTSSCSCSVGGASRLDSTRPSVSLSLSLPPSSLKSHLTQSVFICVSWHTYITALGSSPETQTIHEHKVWNVSDELVFVKQITETSSLILVLCFTLIYWRVS